jgi:hypothetical protein
MSYEAGFYDTHTHSEGRSFLELREMAERGIKKINSCAFYPVTPLYYGTLIDLFRKLMEFEVSRGSKAGLKIYPAIGIHPRCIPPKWGRVVEYMEENPPTIIGEIGLEEGSELEVEVLTSQLLLAKKLDIPCIIHTPRRNKESITEKTIEILEKLGFPETIAVIDHVSLDTVGMIHRRGYFCGLTVEEGKLSVEDTLEIVEEYEPERLMLNSDSGFSGSEYLSVANTAGHLLEKFERDVVEKVCLKNAEFFFRN